MTNFALLNNVEHQDLKVITERSAAYGDNVMSCMALPFEFRSLQAHYPILLQTDGDGNLYPTALLGFQENENLYLDDSGWNAGYIPAMMQKEPFLIGRQKTETDENTRVLSIDMDHPRVSLEEGEPLFQPLGGRTPYLESCAELLETIYRGYEHCREFMLALQKHDLTEAVNFEITLNDGSRNQLIGFSGLNEEKIQNLPGDVLAEFSQQGFLMPIFMMLASTANMGRLIAVKNAQL